MGVKNERKESKKSQLKRRKQKEDSIKIALAKNIPEKTTMLYQPYGITMLKGDLSPMKLNMMVELIEQFQDKMKEQLHNKAHNIKSDLFDNGKIPVIKIPFNTLDVLPKHYAELHNAALELLTLTYETTTVNEDGITMTNISPLFSRISVPQKTIESEMEESELADSDITEPGSDNPKEKYNYKNNKRRLGYIEIVMNPEVGVQALTIDKSFTRYIKEMTRNRRCVYTGRLYMFISTYCNLGKWDIDYQEFRKLLGFTVLKEENGKMIEDIVQYPNFSDVKRRVLEPPMQELKELAQAGKVNCYYEYEPIYQGVRKRGNPTKIHFRIYKTDLGRALDNQTELVKNIEYVRQFMQSEFNIGVRDANYFCKMLGVDNIIDFQDKMLEVKKYITDPKRGVRDPKLYAITALQKWLKESIPEVQEIKDVTQESQVNQQTVETTAPLEETLSEEETSKWMKFLDYMKDDVTPEEYATWFFYLKLLKVEENVITIGVPAKYFVEWLNGQFKESFYKNLAKAFKSLNQVRYSVVD